MIGERPWVTGTREEVWDTIFGAEGLGTVPAEPGEACTLHLGGGKALEGTVVLSDRPWAFAGMVTSLNDGVLHVEMEGTGERWKMGVWLSVYGLEEERCKEIGAALRQTMSRLFPRAGLTAILIHQPGVLEQRHNPERLGIPLLGSHPEPLPGLGLRPAPRRLR